MSLQECEDALAQHATEAAPEAAEEQPPLSRAAERVLKDHHTRLDRLAQYLVKAHIRHAPQRACCNVALLVV
jgi:hypothetical protein